MRNIFLNITSFVYILVFTINGQTYQKTELGVKSVINSIDVEIQFYNPSTVRILKSPEGKTLIKQSLSVITVPQKTVFNIKQKDVELLLNSKNIQVCLNLENGKISFLTSTGESLLNEKVNSVEFTDYDDAGVKTYSVCQSFVLDKDEAIYGLGQQEQGKMVQRNLKLNMIQGNTDDYIPFFVSVKGYGLFWDNYSPTVFEDNPEST
jgi:alpha-D-xyloside xylohydrolase